MRPFTFLLVAIGLAALTVSSCQGQPKTDGNWKPYGEALTLATKQNKKILVDVYTDWCGWCKKMDKDVYANGKIASYLKDNFIIVKLNAESGTEHQIAGSRKSEADIASEWGVRSYPTTVFLNPDGSLITLVPGYIESAKFLPMLSYMQGDHYKTTSWNTFLDSWQKK